jgi:ABC-type metal ion transport system substrate-binding protein
MMASNPTYYERGIQSSVTLEFWKFLDLLIANQLLTEDSDLYNNYFERVLFLDVKIKQRT